MLQLNAFHKTAQNLASYYYSEPHRFYHTIEHVKAMLDGYFYHFKEQASDEEILAIIYHDAIYNPWSSNNEADSIDLMYTHRPVYFPHINDSLLQRTGVIIMDTTHKAPPEKASQRVVDLDMMILGRPVHVYDEYVQNTRKEYGRYSNDEWSAGRKAFLKKILAQERIFYTEELYGCYEQLARLNLTNELNKLK